MTSKVLGETRHGTRGGRPDVRLLGGWFVFDSPDSAVLVSLLPSLVHVRGIERLSVLVRLVGEEASERRSGRDLVLTRLVEVLLIEALRATPGEDAPPGLLRGLADANEIVTFGFFDGTLEELETSQSDGDYESRRAAIEPYVDAVIANGIYEVELRFAELSARVDFGERLFDVIVEDTLVLPAHDIAYEVGRYAADDNRFFVEVEDGRIDVRFIGRPDTEPAVINALRVTHRPDR